MNLDCPETQFDRKIRVSVIIPALNEESVIGRCLEALRQNVYPRDAFEVIVVDNGSKDRTVEIALGFSGDLNLRTLHCSHVLVTSLRNFGAASAQGDILAFLDADCIVPTDWLDSAVFHFSKKDEGIVGGHCSTPPNSPWVPRTWYLDRQTYKTGKVSYLPGANLIIRHVDFVRVGRFDESLETNEDCELCERARQRGLQVTAYSELGVIHLRDPQTLWAFYRKQAWHGKHVIKVFLRNLPSTVNLKPVTFALFTVLMAVGTVVCLLLGSLVWTAACIGILLLPSLALSLRIAVRRGRWKDFFPLVVLNLVYGAGRATALINPMNWWGKSKTSDRLKAEKAGQS